jgi:selenocysteine-specific elongation factor
MVAGATGIDLFLMVVAADDGVMPQTREHAAVLRGLGVQSGVVAITKADIADPERARAEAAELFGGAEIVACSAKTGEGVEELRAALARAAGQVSSRAGDARAAVLHVDRSFAIRGAGRVVTGTLWSGSIGRGDELLILPAGTRTRVREVQVHDERVERAAAGQRVAVNLRDGEPVRGDVLAGEPIEPAHILDVQLDDRLDHGAQVHAHHGTRESPAKVAWLGGRFHQLRCSEPLVARRGDRLVLRGAGAVVGGTVLEAPARRHGPSNDVLVRLTSLARGEEPRVPASVRGQTPHGQPLPPEADALLERLRAAGHEPPPHDSFGADEQALLARLRHAGRAERVGPFTFHPDALDAVRERVVAILRSEGTITLARLRDELQTSRRYAQALLEHLDAQRVTRRVGDERVAGSRLRRPE